jgi:hypothetical protein
MVFWIVDNGPRPVIQIARLEDDRAVVDDWHVFGMRGEFHPAATSFREGPCAPGDRERRGDAGAGTDRGRAILVMGVDRDCARIEREERRLVDDVAGGVKTGRKVDDKRVVDTSWCR